MLTPCYIGWGERPSMTRDYSPRAGGAPNPKAMTCAGIISHEVGVMMAKHNQEMERG